MRELTIAQKAAENKTRQIKIILKIQIKYEKDTIL